ncbi:MAG: lysine exporter LysO family protein [Bacteroidota bacterium]|nr:lysine exporter LysO family protein [Bacteroidota bacterium]
MKNSLIILAFFTSGLLLGLFKKLPDILIHNDLSLYSLYLLMLLVGVGIGAERASWRVIAKMKVRVALIPLSVIIGTLIGVSAVSLLLPSLRLKECLAIGAGFGYYSLSSVLITQLGSETLGVIALISNILREIITLLATPVFVRYAGKLAGIASGGATSMDTTLPVIIKYSGKEWGIISVFNGIILTILVPLLVTFILKVL